jgi:hypothetical protein
LTKSPKIYLGEKIASSTNVLGKLVIYMQKLKLDLYLSISKNLRYVLTL